MTPGMAMAKDNPPSWMQLLQIDTSHKQNSTVQNKVVKKMKSTQLKIVGGFLPYELGGMVEEGNESSQKAGCRCLTLFCPAQIQPRVTKEHLTALHQMRDLVPAPLSFAWCIPPAGRDKGPGTSQCSTELLCTQTASDWLLLEMQWD